MNAYSNETDVPTWQTAVLIEADSIDARVRDALISFNRLLAWMVAAGRVRLLYWDDHLDVEKCWVELLIPLDDGQWALWDSGLYWEELTPSIIDGFVDISRPSPGTTLDPITPGSPFPRTDNGWLWLWADLAEWLEDSGLNRAIPVMVDDALDPEQPAAGRGLGGPMSAAAFGVYSGAQEPLVPSRKLRAYMALRAGATYVGLTEVLREFRWGTNEYAWSPWGPPATAVRDIPLPVEGIDFGAIADLARTCAEETTDWDVQTFVAAVIEPVLIAYPGTPAWLLSELITRERQPRLLSQCAFVPEDTRERIAVNMGSAVNALDERIEIPGTLLGPAAQHSPSPLPAHHPLVQKIAATEERVKALGVSTTDDTVLEALSLLVNLPLWVIAVAIKDGWIGAPTTQDAEALDTDLDDFTTWLSSLLGSSQFSLTGQELQRLRESLHTSWRNFAGLETDRE